METMIKNSDRNPNNYARSLIEASLDPLVTISAKGQITDVNEASVNVTGIPRKKLIGTDFSDYFTDPKKAQEGYLQVFEKGFVADYPLTIKHKNGKLTDVLYNASVYKDDKGNVLGVFAAARDITAQKQSSQYARSLIEASLDPLVTISAEGKITDVNEASVNVTGIQREKLIGTDFSDYFTNPQKAREGYRQVFEKGFVADYPLTIKHKNGKLTDVLYNASVYKDDKGKVLGVFAAARDVTTQKWAIELKTVNKELTFQNKEKEKRADELIIANKELAYQNREKEKRADESIIDNKEIAYQDSEKGKRAEELAIANKELGFQNKEKEKRAAELIIANKELALQNKEKEKKAAKLIIANEELAFQSREKEKRADELIIVNKELAYQNSEKEKRAEELAIANKELSFQNEEKEKRAAELIIANKELALQNKEKEEKAAKLIIANKELAYQNREKEKRADELIIANKELAFQNSEKEKRAEELIIANKELGFQNEEKEKRAAELVIANKELAFQNKEKEKKAAKLIISYKELAFQNREKEKRADELIIANKELAFQNEEKEKRADELSSAYEEHRKTNEYLENLIDSASAPIIVWDRNYKITRFNQAFENITGRTEKEVIGESLEILFPPDSVDNSMDLIRETLEGERLDVDEMNIAHIDGSVRIILWNSANIMSSDGKTPIATIAQGNDITQRKQAEEEIKKMNESLEQKVIERTKQLEDANKELETFSYSVSHDLRAPLRHIGGFVDLLSKNLLSKLDETGLRYLNIISESSVEMGNFIDALLTFSRLNRDELQRKKINSKRMVAHILKNFNNEIAERTVEINIEEFPDAMGDETLINQVWFNLISNALKYSRNKEKAIIKIGGKIENDIPIFYIKDNGVGFDMTYADKLFGVFQRLHKARDFEGIGIGLANINRIIIRHGGKCWAESEVDKGATFYFSLPNN